MKLLIAIPSLDYVHVDFMKCLCKLTDKLHKENIDFDVNINSGTLVYVARDKLAQHAYVNHYTHVLWLDSDMIFTDEVFEDLFFHRKPFVSGLCHARRKPYMPCFFSSLSPVERFDKYPGELFEVAGVGMACVLMETKILWEVMLKYGTCFCPEKELGEDLAFCNRARSIGYQLFVDPHVVIGHIGHVVIYPEDHEKYMAEIGALC